MNRLRIMLAAALAVVCVLPGAARAAQSRPGQAMGKAKPAPDLRDVKYGPHERNVLDLWRAESDTPTPLVVFIHGGGFRAGDKSRISPSLLELCLKSGVSVAAINYRLSQQAAFPAPMHDSARAIQFLRLNAKQWNLDPKRVAATGGSAGAGISLWIGLHDDLADAGSDDPVERQSTRLTCMGVYGAQSSYDPQFIEKLIGSSARRHPALLPFYGLKPGELDTPRAHKLYERASPITYVSADDPPVWMFYSEPNEDLPPNARAGQGIHHPRFGEALKAKLEPLKIECVLRHRTDYKAKARQQAEREMVDFFLRHFRQAPGQSAPTTQSAGQRRPVHLQRYKLAKLVLEPRTDDPALFDSSRVECPMVVRWNNRWLMFYTAIKQTRGKADSTIGMAVSDDLVHWRDRRQVLRRGAEGAFDHGGISGPFVWSEGDELKMVYIGFPQLGYESRPGRHGVAFSRDGITWEKAESNPVHDVGSKGTWNDACLYKTFVMKHDGRYWMFYNAYGTRDRCEQIGLATSPDLRRWAEHPDNPLLRRGDPEKDRDHRIIGDPWIMRRIMRQGDIWEMYYFAFDGEHAREHLATSKDLIHWSKSPHNPIMDAGRAGSYDAVHCHKPCIILDKGVYCHFYTAVGPKGDHEQYRPIALATSRRLPGVEYRQ